jgi:hypothetical protein
MKSAGLFKARTLSVRGGLLRDCFMLGQDNYGPKQACIAYMAVGKARAMAIERASS